MKTTKKQRGSVLIVALIFSAIIAIGLTSYMKLALNSLKMADRAFYSNGAQNLVDIGLEHALWSLNNDNWPGGGFTVRSGHANQYQGTFPASTAYQFSQGVVGEVKVWVDNTTSHPHAVARATVTLADGSTIVKQAESHMGRRSYFGNGMVARNKIKFVGNVAIDSWNSNPDNNDATAMVPYSTSVDTDGGRIASLSVEVESISVGNADVYGYAAIGGSSLAGLKVGSTGRVGPYGTPNGTIDSARVTYDFTANFPDVESPVSSEVSRSYTIGAISSETTLPVTGHLPADDGKYYYYVPSISVAGNDDIFIAPNSQVVLIVTNTTGNTVSATGNSTISIPSTSKLALYASGNIDIAGNGVLSGASGLPNAPKAFELYGTRTAAEAAVSAQTIAIKGNGFLSGIVYAPNATVDVNGNGDTYGAVIANNVNMNGNGNFHYDESLADLENTELFSVWKWRELSTATERAVYDTQLAF